jgi:putative PIN family toxin of toxin-antitoxin system
MRIVLDTNVLARGSPGSTGLAREIVDRSTRPPHLLIFSAETLAELGRVMRYPRLRKLHGLSDAEIDGFVANLWLGAARETIVVVEMGGCTGEPNDDPIIHTAIAGAADVLCTRDRHILNDPAVIAHCASFGIRVLTDIDLIQMLRQP